MSVTFGAFPPAVPDLQAALVEFVKDELFDFLVCPLAHPRHRRQAAPHKLHQVEGGAALHGEQDPFTRSDLLLDSAQWSTFVVGALSPWINVDHPSLPVARNAAAAFEQEIRWAGHLSVPAVLLPPPAPPATNYMRLIRQTTAKLSYTHLWVRVPLVDPSHSPESAGPARDPWEWWNELRMLCEHHKQLCPVLDIGRELPEQKVLDRWFGEPVRAVVLSPDAFLTNRAGFPVLPRRHQAFIQRLYSLNIQVMLQTTGAAADQQRFHLEYLRHLYHERPAPTMKDEFEIPYYDYLQSPLQPLMDNLESQTYEVFEKDPIKYQQYEKAVHRALLDRAKAPTVLMVVGAGRGPLVRASLRAADQAEHPHDALTVYAVEKNPNAVVTLLNMRRSLGWGDRVTIVSADMREWEAPQKADILVSELLGSFGDNELSPECLDGAQRFLKEGGASIPTAYTSFVAPITAHKAWAGVNGYEDVKHFETAFVCCLHNFMELDAPKAVFTFTHPNYQKPIDNERFEELEFTSSVTALVHGFIGYFDAQLYKDVHCSILPATFSTGMFSWFPIFFPLRVPFVVREGERLRCSFARCCTGAKVWYEWSTSAPVVSALHNPNGRSYWIGL